MSRAFAPVYSDEQREAIATAYEDRKIRPAKRVCELAAAGDLEHRGAKLDPFTVPENTVRDLARDLRKRRTGERTSQLAALEPRDAIEALRRRLVNAADAMLDDLEQKVKKDAGTADPERLRQITRAVREAAALPGPTDPRPTAPGSKAGGKRNGGATQGGLGGELLKAARAEGETAHGTTPPRENGDGRTETPEHSAPPSEPQRLNGQDDGSPGVRVRELALRHSVELEGGAGA